MRKHKCMFCKKEIDLDKIIPDIEFKGKFICRDCYNKIDAKARGII